MSVQGLSHVYLSRVCISSLLVDRSNGESRGYSKRNPRNAGFRGRTSLYVVSFLRLYNARRTCVLGIRSRVCCILSVLHLPATQTKTFKNYLTKKKSRANFALNRSLITGWHFGDTSTIHLDPVALTLTWVILGYLEDNYFSGVLPMYYVSLLSVICPIQSYQPW